MLEQGVWEAEGSRWVAFNYQLPTTKLRFSPSAPSLNTFVPTVCTQCISATTSLPPPLHTPSFPPCNRPHFTHRRTHRVHTAHRHTCSGTHRVAVHGPLQVPPLSGHVSQRPPGCAAGGLHAHNRSVFVHLKHTNSRTECCLRHWINPVGCTRNSRVCVHPASAPTHPHPRRACSDTCTHRHAHAYTHAHSLAQ